MEAESIDYHQLRVTPNGFHALEIKKCELSNMKKKFKHATYSVIYYFFYLSKSELVLLLVTFVVTPNDSETGWT